MMEISPDVHLIPGKIANAFLLIDGQELTLIDTDLPAKAKHILAYIRQIGHSPEQIRRILITHTDGDHVGGLATLKAISHAQVYASQPEADALARGQHSRPLKTRGLVKVLETISAPLFRFAPLQVDQVLHGGETLPVRSGLEVISTPGHTPGHLSYFLRQESILFAGDSFRAPKGQVQISSGINTWNQAQANASAKIQTALEPQILCVAHGPLIRNATTRMPC